MRRSSVLASILAVGGLAACGADAPASATAAALSTTAPATCGGGSSPVDSSLALAFRGGGCYPVGIHATGLELFPLVDPEWAPVVNGKVVTSTPMLVQGTVYGSHVSNNDFPTSHQTVDQNTEILVDSDETSCLATGNVTGPDNHPVNLELEWEIGSYPSWAWAGPGDRIVAWGRWIFDCGHPDAVAGKCSGTGAACYLDSDCGSGACSGTVWNYRSEMHPPQAVAVIRTGGGAVLPGAASPVPATQADIYVSGDGGGAGDVCVLTHRDSFAEALAAFCAPFRDPVAFQPAGAPALNSADFAFDVPLPRAPRGARPVWQIVPRPEMPHPLWPSIPARVEVTPFAHGADPHLHVVVRMTEPVGGQLPTSFAGTLLAGWSRARSPHLTHVRVTVEGIDVRDALKPPLLVPGTSLALPVPDGWRVETAVNGQWQELPTVPVVAGGAGPYPVSAVQDLFLPRGGELRVHAQATSLHCQDVIRGLSLAPALGSFPAPEVALLCATAVEPDGGEVDATFPGPTFGARDAPYEVASDVGAYALRFRIERVDDGGGAADADDADGD